MNDKKTTVTYKVVKFFVKLFYQKIQVEGLENLPTEPSIIVGNHCQLHGPLSAELYMPIKRYIWCAGQMMKLRDVPKYAFEDFWSGKSKYSQPFYKLASYLIAPLSVCIFNNAHTIAVYRDTRIVSTFKSTVKHLQMGQHIIVFPEFNEKHNNIIYNFQDKFIDIAKLYYKKTGKELNFAPLYIAPKLKKMYIGKPVKFNAAEPIDNERSRIREYLMAEITEIAESLPLHTVVPYRNIKKKDYPKNRGEGK